MSNNQVTMPVMAKDELLTMRISGLLKQAAETVANRRYGVQEVPGERKKGNLSTLVTNRLLTDPEVREELDRLIQLTNGQANQ